MRRPAVLALLLALAVGLGGGGGGVIASASAESQAPIECEGDACQALPPPPEDPTIGTLVPGPPNPPVHFPGTSCKKGQVRKHGKCVKRPAHKRAHRRSANR